MHCVRHNLCHSFVRSRELTQKAHLLPHRYILNYCLMSFQDAPKQLDQGNEDRKHTKKVCANDQSTPEYYRKSESELVRDPESEIHLVSGYMEYTYLYNIYLVCLSILWVYTPHELLQYAIRK